VIVVMKKAAHQFGIVLLGGLISACQTGVVKSQVSLGLNEPLVLTGFNLAEFEPGVNCRDDLPAGKTMSLVNGYRTRLVGKIEGKKAASLDYYLYAIESDQLQCRFYFIDVVSGLTSYKPNVLDATNLYNKRLFSVIEGMLSQKQYECISIVFENRKMAADISARDKKINECIIEAAKKISGLGVEGVMSRNGQSNTYMIIEDNVFLGE
jgi:hypothetical protein